MRCISYWYSIVIVSAMVIPYARTQEAATCCQMPTVDAIRLSLHNASEQDLHILLNLLYWSYQRSHISLKTQIAAEKNLHEQWKAWQSCADRRLNPKAVPSSYHKHVEHAQFETLQEEFHSVQTCYTHIVEKATNAQSYSSSALLDFVTSLREKARQHVMYVIKQQLKVLTQHLEQKLSDQAADLRYEHRGIISYLMNQIAVASFAQLDASWRSHSNQLMMQFFSIQELFNSVWTTIEVTRAQFYAAYFELIHQVMCEKKLSRRSFTNMVADSVESQPVPFVLSITHP